MLITATRAAEWCGGRRCGGDPILSGVCIDSRRARCGDLFVALPGERADGHDFAAEAMNQGAAAVMVATPVSEVCSQIMVVDCESALARLASAWRHDFNGKVAAITGSNGKTTVKEMLAAIVREVTSPFRVFASRGNMNNRLGMSLSVLEIAPQHKFAVLEAGMDAAGELRELGGICRPHVAVVNNAQRAHLGMFSSVTDIARAKGELIESLSADGIAVIAADDPHLSLWRELAGKRRTITFGFTAAADYRGEWRDGRLYMPSQSQPLQLQVAGRHNAHNALAAAAAAEALGFPTEKAAVGLESFTGVDGRLQFKKTPGGAMLIDDTYNANPDSLAAALTVLAECDGEKFAVLGDMLALGDAAAKEHRAAGEAAAAAGAELLTVGEEMKAAAGRHFADRESLLEYLRGRLEKCKQATVLVKGSRGMHMETVARALESE